MPACSAYGCTNRPGKKIKGISFHRFPKDPTLREAWVKACRRIKWSPSPVSVLCSEHFSEDQMDRTSFKTAHLKEKAVPTIFKSFPSYYQKVPVKRKSPKKRSAHVSVESQNGITLTQNEDTPAQLESVSDTIHVEFNSNLLLLAELSRNEKSTQTEQVQTKDSSTSPIEVNEIALGVLDAGTLKRKFDKSCALIEKYKKKIKILQQKSRRQERKITTLSSLFGELKEEHFIHEDSLSCCSE